MERTLRKNTILFRGTRVRNDYMRNGPVYFLYNSNGRNIAERSYTGGGGSVYNYRVSRNLKLLDMGNPDSIRYLMNKVKNTKESNNLMRSFRLSENGREIYRNSDAARDLIVAKLVCDLGYDGYIAPKLKKSKNTSKNDMFHQEIVICSPKNKVNHEDDIQNKHNDPFSTPPPRKRFNYKLNVSSPKKRRLFNA